MQKFEDYLKTTKEVGYVESIIHSVFYVNGIPSAKLHELVLTEQGHIGIVQAILPELVEVMLIQGEGLSHNLRVVRTNETFVMPVTEKYLGRVISPFGIPVDELGPVGEVKTHYPIDPHAPGINARSRVKEPMETGVVSVDMQVPIGKGQRELILGDQKTGKTTFALQIIGNQASSGSVCVYVSIGKKRSDLKFVVKTLKDINALSQTVIISANASDPAPLIYLAPFAGLAVAEYFRDRGREVVVIFDDLTTHAKFYRETSLITRRTPGRQSYPGDIFHLHARLVERAGNFKKQNGKTRPITLLPIAETLEGDLAGYIQTNLMAMTDGHVFFDVAEAKKGRHPAVSFTLSVSRVGNQTKTPLERELSRLITEKLTAYRKAEEVSRFGVELTTQTLQALDQGEKLIKIFDQESQIIIPKGLQLIYLGLFFGGAWEKKTAKEVQVEKIRILGEYLQGKYGNLPIEAKLSTSVKELVNNVITYFKLGKTTGEVKEEPKEKKEEKKPEEKKEPVTTS
ncbi:MAG TPA: ATPase domain-containing protein [Candidatus Saccharimonadales bacterium]|nr:ATPase domain-containing protein [Candidatus Saccharimonadales bacterium]